MSLRREEGAGVKGREGGGSMNEGSGRGTMTKEAEGIGEPGW